MTAAFLPYKRLEIFSKCLINEQIASVTFGQLRHRAVHMLIAVNVNMFFMLTSNPKNLIHN